MEDTTGTIHKLSHKNNRLQLLVNKLKLNNKLQNALILLSEQASTVAELTLLYPAIHNILVQYLPSESFYVVLENQVTRALELSYFVDEKDRITAPMHEDVQFSEGITGYVFSSKKTLHLTRKEMQEYVKNGQFRAQGSPSEHWVGIPIYREQDIIGVMVSQSYDVNNGYSEQQIQLLEFIALYLSTAIERVKKRELLESEVKVRTRALMQSNETLNAEISQRKRALERQQILFKISELASQISDINSVYSRVHDIISSITFADNLYISLYDKDTNSLSFPYFVDEYSAAKPRKFAKGFSELVISTERCQLIDTDRANILTLSGVVERITKLTPMATSWMGAPLKSSNGVIGLIACQAYDNKYSFTHEDIELISYVSHQIASVLQTHLANQALKDSHQQLERRVEEKTKALQQTNMHLKMQIEERLKIEKQLYHDAHHDALTGLPNRSLFLTQLEKTFQQFHRHPKNNFAVLFIDLDNFKSINDELGHHAGDEFLVWVAKVFLECIREHDLLARLAGDEFVILLDHLADKQQAEDVAKRLIKVMQQPFCIKGVCIQSGASIGVTYSSKRYTNTDEIIRDADAAMYYAKNAGRNRFEFYHPLLNAGTKSHIENNEHHLDQLPTHFRNTEIADLKNPTLKINMLEAFGEHPILGNTSFDILKKFSAAKTELTDVELQLFYNAQEIAHQQQSDTLFACSTLLLESQVFKHVIQTLVQQGQPSLSLLFDESELRQASSIQLENLRALSTQGFHVGINNFAHQRCDLTLISQFDFKYVLLSSTFSKRVLQDACYELQLKGILAITDIKHTYVIAKGPAILNFQSLLEKHGLSLFFSKQNYLHRKEHNYLEKKPIGEG